MTGWGLERTLRTAVPTAVAPIGGSALMPPHSQGAERRTDRHAGRTGSRWALRALVIGGLAGAAWLLTGAAAHAADREPAPGALLGSPLIGAVVDGDSTSTVGTILHTAVRPQGADRPSKHRDVTSALLSAPAHVLSAPVKALTVTRDEAPHVAAPATDVVDRVVRDLIRPGLTGGPSDPVTAPPTRADHPAGPPPHAATPPAPAPGQVRGVTPVAHHAPVRTIPAPGRTAGDRDTAGITRSAGERHPAGTVRHRVALTAASPDSVRDTAPGSDRSQPLQAHLGALSSGISTSGSSTAGEGGSAADLPAAVAGTSTTHHGPSTATDVGLRRHDAEAPTVSPD